MNPLEKSIVNWIKSQGYTVKNTEFIDSGKMFFVQVEREKILEAFIAFLTKDDDLFFPSHFFNSLRETYARNNNFENTHVILLTEEEISKSSIKAIETTIEKANKIKVILTCQDNDSLEVIKKFDYTED